MIGDICSLMFRTTEKQIYLPGKTSDSVHSKKIFRLVRTCQNFVKDRSSHRRRSLKKGVLKFRKFHRKTPVLESLFSKVAGLRACNFIKKRLQQRCFPVKFAKFLRTTILKNICEQLLLNFF